MKYNNKNLRIQILLDTQKIHYLLAWKHLLVKV